MFLTSLHIEFFFSTRCNTSYLKLPWQFWDFIIFFDSFNAFKQRQFQSVVVPLQWMTLGNLSLHFFFTSFLLNKANTSIAVSQENIRIKKQFKCLISWFFFLSFTVCSLCIRKFLSYKLQCPVCNTVSIWPEWFNNLQNLPLHNNWFNYFFFLSQFLIFNREPRRMTWEITVYWTTWSWVFVLQGKKYNWLFLHVQQPDEDQVFLR